VVHVSGVGVGGEGVDGFGTVVVGVVSRTVVVDVRVAMSVVCVEMAMV
jgi:hypothetical protein